MAAQQQSKTGMGRLATDFSGVGYQDRECRNMAGYTSKGVGSSIAAVRINCLPEIPLHRLWRTE